jgi:hypothetical protein
MRVDTLDPGWTFWLLGEKHTNEDKHRGHRGEIFGLDESSVVDAAALLAGTHHITKRATEEPFAGSSPGSHNGSFAPSSRPL